MNCSMNNRLLQINITGLLSKGTTSDKAQQYYKCSRCEVTKMDFLKKNNIWGFVGFFPF